MTYPLKFLQRAGLVSTMLIGGVVGGLMAPLPSDAGTPADGTLSLTLQVDGLPATPANLLVTSGGDPAPGVCTATETSNNYTSCWNVNTGSTLYGTAGRKYRMVRADSNVAGRFRVADKLGQDKMQLVGVKFEPEVTTWSQSQTVTVVLKEHNVFNSSVNINNATDANDNNPAKYSLVIRSGGAFSAPSGQSPVGDIVTFTGSGKFQGSSFVNMLSPPGPNNNNPVVKNSLPLSFTVEGPVDDPGPLSFDGNSNATLGQVVTYPQFVCIDATPNFTTTCRPDITLTTTISFVGPDSMTLTGFGDVYCAQCALTAQEKIDLAKRKQQLQKKLEQKIALVNRPSPGHTPGLDALIALLTKFLDVRNTPDPDCEGEQLNEIEAINAAILEQETCTGCKPAVPAAPHYYAVINSSPWTLTWDQARAAAQGLGVGWDLATITTAAEQAIINYQLGDPSDFVGLQDYWIGGIQPIGSNEPGSNWQWINYEGTFWNNEQPTEMFANWGTSEPNNCGGNENHVTVDNRYLWSWNDLGDTCGGAHGYIAEGPTPLSGD